jgi:hypothetical protein
MEGTLVWCVGIFDPMEAKFSQFFLEPEADEPSMLRDSLQLLSQRPSSRILSFSGSAFESRILRKRLEAHNFSTDISRRILDVHPKICWKLKLKSTGGLKLLSSKYGYNYKYEMDGPEAASLYGDYQKSKKQSIRSLLLRYNEDDVMALIHLAKRIPDAFDSSKFLAELDDRERELLRFESSTSRERLRFRQMRPRLEPLWIRRLRLVTVAIGKIRPRSFFLLTARHESTTPRNRAFWV